MTLVVDWVSKIKYIYIIKTKKDSILTLSSKQKDKVYPLSFRKEKWKNPETKGFLHFMLKKYSIYCHFGGSKNGLEKKHWHTCTPNIFSVDFDKCQEWPLRLPGQKPEESHVWSLKQKWQTILTKIWGWGGVGGGHSWHLSKSVEKMLGYMCVSASFPDCFWKGGCI